VDFSGGSYRKFFGDFSQRTRQPLPSSSFVHYRLQDPDTKEMTNLIIPFAVLKPSKPFHDRDSYYKTYCEKAEEVERNTTISSRGDRVMEIIQEIPLEPGLIVHGNSKSLKKLPVLPEAPVPITEATSISQFFHLDSDTAVMKIGSFVCCSLYNFIESRRREWD
jgi:hypothetical protein